jgi:hypothetical protein
VQRQVRRARLVLWRQPLPRPRHRQALALAVDSVPKGEK